MLVAAVRDKGTLSLRKAGWEMFGDTGTLSMHGLGSGGLNKEGDQGNWKFFLGRMD